MTMTTALTAPDRYMPIINHAVRCLLCSLPVTPAHCTYILISVVFLEKIRNYVNPLLLPEKNCHMFVGILNVLFTSKCNVEIYFIKMNYLCNVNLSTTLTILCNLRVITYFMHVV